MSVERGQTAVHLLDVLDRILDKGIVIDAWARVSVGGIEVLTIEGRVIVASFQTYASASEVLTATTLISPPPILTQTPVIRPPRNRRRARP